MKKEKNILQTHPSQSGFLIALVSAVILSFTGILIRIISVDHHLPALILAFWRDVFVTLCLFPVFILVKPKLLRPGRKNLLYLMLYGAILAFFNIFWTLSVTLTGAAVATVLVYASGGFTALLGWLFLKESLGWQKILAVVLSLSGCLLVSGAIHRAQWETNLPGIFTGLLSGLLYAIYSLMGRKASQKHLDPWTTLFYTFGFAALLLLTVNLLPIDILQATANNPSEIFMLGRDDRGWLLLFALGAGPTLLGFGLYNVSLSLLAASTANLILTLEPVFTVTTAYFLLGERLTLIEGIGAALIMIAVLLLRTKLKEK